MRVAVIVASKHGSTREIAEAIAAELSAEGLDAALIEAGEIEAFEGFDAVVLGSAVYAGHWLKPAQSILDERSADLSKRATWLFSSGPIGDPPKPDVGEPEGLAEAVEQIGARGHRTFSGKLDKAVLGRGERMLVRALRAPEGDFRDWDEIRAWAREIASELGC